MSKRPLKVKLRTCTLPSMMLPQKTQIIYTLSYPKSMDHMYVTRNVRPSYNLAIEDFSYLFQPTTKTRKLNKYTCSKQQGKDTHEVSSRSNTIWLPKLALDTIIYGWVTHTCMCQNDKSLNLAQTTHPIQEPKA